MTWVALGLLAGLVLGSYDFLTKLALRDKDQVDGRNGFHRPQGMSMPVTAAPIPLRTAPNPGRCPPVPSPAR